MGRASRRKRERRSWVERHPDGSKTIHMNGEMDELVAGLDKDQRAAFEVQFGRPMGPEDPWIWDPDSQEPEPPSIEKVEAAMVEIMQEAGIPPALIYAYQQSGVIVTEANEHLVNPEDLEAFYDAQARYFRAHPAGGG